MEYSKRCLIVPVFYASLARTLCAGITEGGAGASMFTTAVSVSGDVPATHYISDGLIGSDFASLLPLTTYTSDIAGLVTATVTPGQPSTITLLAKGAVTLSQITALLDAIDVTQQEPFTALARMGLQIIRLKGPL